MKFDNERSLRVTLVALFCFALLFSISLTMLTLVSIRSKLPTAEAKGFDPGYIISDADFKNYNSLTTSAISAFIKEKGKVCSVNNAPSKERDQVICLKDYRQNTRTYEKDSYCKKYTGASNESVATIIHKVSVACTTNPEVLIIMLQKEMGLVTDPYAEKWQYVHAMGFGCPDSAACDSTYNGLQNQVYHAARQFKVYEANKTSYNFHGGMWADIKYNPKSSCGTQRVYIKNQATAGLYNYTPYVPNQAALNAGYDKGDSCSSYGNRNFYNYWRDWFHSSSGCGVLTEFCDVPNNYKFIDEINWASSKGITTGVTAIDFKPSNSVNREQMAKFLYRMSNGKVVLTKPTPKFTDLTGSKTEINWLARTGITTGLTSTKYNPKGVVTREQMALFLYRLAGNPSLSDSRLKYWKNKLKDIKKTGSSQNAICWLAEVGVTTGVTASTFAPKVVLSRGQMVAFLYRFVRIFPQLSRVTIK
ncbi:MAG: S-layer homology domain-containing protein [Candidatus Ancillula sp.]|jgi:hypothetical protein|nr:S-layer homology domain-containing protein [Candidatus Ancillula sp.]